ncbi:hypothetical protein I3V78_27740 [Archangium primigenium]|nr:hypothetical protein [Archangium primigenium]
MALGAMCLLLACDAPLQDTAVASRSHTEAPLVAPIEPPAPLPVPGDGELILPAGEDTVPPVTAITDPVSGSTHYQPVFIWATASDNVGVTRVEFYANNTLLKTLTGSTYFYGWDTKFSPPGLYTLTTRAYDAAGNVATSNPVYIQVARDSVPPSVTCTAPAPGATVSGVVKIEASASDDLGVRRVDFYVDAAGGSGGTRIGSVTTPPYSIGWDSTSLADGSKTLRCEAWDVGLNSQSASVQVVTSNPQTVTYDALGAPRCRLGVAFCDTRNLTLGQGSQGKEPNYPNTLSATRCADGIYGSLHYGPSVDRIVVYPRDGSTSPLHEGQLVRADVTIWADSGTGGYPSDRLDLYLAPDYRAPVWKHLTTLTPSGKDQQKLGITFTLPPGDTQVLRASLRKVYDPLAPCAAGLYVDNDDLLLDVLPAVPDAEPPQLAWAAPLAHATVQGTTPLVLQVSDNTRVSLVKIFRANESTPVATIRQAPFTASWDTFSLPDGPYTLTAQAYDSSGNLSTATIDVVVDNDHEAPTVTLTAPVPQEILSGVYTFKVDTSDNSPLARVQYLAGGEMIGESTTPPFDFSFDTAWLARPSMTFSARAYDIWGNRANSQDVVATLAHPNRVSWSSSLKVPVCLQDTSRCSTEALLDSAHHGEPNYPNTIDGCTDYAYYAWSPDYSIDSMVVRSKDGGPLTRGKPARLRVTYWYFTSKPVGLAIYYRGAVSGTSWSLLHSRSPDRYSGYGTQSVELDFTPSATSSQVVLRAQLATSTASCVSSGVDDRDQDDLVLNLK